MNYGNDDRMNDEDEVQDESDDRADAFAAVGLILLFVALMTTFVATQ